MLPEFPRLKERVMQLAEPDFRRRVRADGLIGAVKATPYFEGAGSGSVAGWPIADIRESRLAQQLLGAADKLGYADAVSAAHRAGRTAVAVRFSNV